MANELANRTLYALLGLIALLYAWHRNRQGQYVVIYRDCFNEDRRIRWEGVAHDYKSAIAKAKAANANKPFALLAWWGE